MPLSPVRPLLPVVSSVDALSVRRLRSFVISALLIWFWAGPSVSRVLAQEEHRAHGVVLQVAPSHKELEVSCDEIPGYMSAMEMSFEVQDARALAKLKPGMAIQFKIVTRGKMTFAEKIHPASTASFESEPMEAGTLSALQSITDPTSEKNALTVGDQVPDFTLTDQAEKQIRLSQFRGKVVLLTFGYSRCPNPNYCLRLSNNLARVEKRFHAQAGKDLVLMTIAIDPEHDRGAVLRAYADSFNADPAAWHFLSGSLPEIKQTAGMFGMNFWNSEGLLTHPLRTLILDRKGRLAVDLEGNQFTSRQLGDLVGTVMKRP